MVSITTPIELYATLDQGVTSPKAAPVRLVCGDENAHEIRVHCTMDGAPADLTGIACQGTVRRGDGVCITLDGSTSGNVASFILTGPCYAVPGLCRISMTLQYGGVTATHTVCTAYVTASRTEDPVWARTLDRAEEATF